MDHGLTVGTFGVVIETVVGLVFDQHGDAEQSGPTLLATSDSVGTLLHWNHPEGNERL